MTTAGTGALLRFMLRRERRGLPWWVVGAGFLVFYQSLGSQSIYGTPERLARFRETIGGNAAMVASTCRCEASSSASRSPPRGSGRSPRLGR